LEASFMPEKAHVHKLSVDRLTVGGIHLLELMTITVYGYGASM